MRPQARPIEFQSYGNKEVVNYSAIANKAKQLSDNVRTVAFDQVNDSITFKSSLIHDKPPVSIKPSDNSINNVSSINCTDGSTITGITSDSSNTDPTKAISANILTDLNTRFTALESKTQNQTATENETTFTGNVQADTFNGYHLGFNHKFYTLPAIPFVNSDLVMEVGRYIDFHYNASTGTDYTSRLYISKPGTLYYDHSFVVNGGDIKARNCIADGGNLNDIASRTKSLETKNTEQDTRLDALESKDIAIEERIGSIEAMDTAQNETISNINTKNDEQDTRLDNLESKDTSIDNDISLINSKNADQDSRLDNIELNTLRVSNTNRNATLEVSNAEGDNNPRTTFRFRIILTFQDPNLMPTFTSQTTKIIGFSFYKISPSGGATEETVDIYADSSNGLTSNIDIVSSTIQKGSIEMILKQTRVFQLSTLGDIFDKVYNPYAIISAATSNQYIISKNLAFDNDIRLSSAESKNNEQDTRLSKLESKISNLLNSIYPVGSIYLSLTKSPPSLGGTWELIDEGKFLYSTTSTSGETGGSLHHTHATSGHVLTVGEMPMHKHTFNGNEITGTVYDIMKYDTAGQINKDPSGAFSVTRYGSRTWQGTNGNNRAFSLTFTATPTGSISYEGNNQAHTHGDTEAEYHIPPYITCFMYKRTA